MKYNYILIIINHLFKIIKFISCWKNIILKQLTHLMLYKIITIYELSNNIVTDYNFIFTNDFQTNLIYILKIVKDMSTAYHL